MWIATGIFSRNSQNVGFENVLVKLPIPIFCNEAVLDVVAIAYAKGAVFAVATVSERLVSKLYDHKISFIGRVAETVDRLGQCQTSIQQAG